MKHVVLISIIWGFVLWLVGYILGILLFPFIPVSLIGWVIMPIGICITMWILLKKIQLDSIQQYMLLAFVWLVIAVVGDYFLLVKLFEPADGYYKVDVYLYYLVTFLLPIIVGWKRTIPKRI